MAFRSTGAQSLVVLVCFVVLGITAAAVWTVDDDAYVPDTTQAVEIWIWPGSRELGRLESVQGRGPAYTIRTLGHPFSIEKDGGTEIWHYPWASACRVTFRDGGVTSTFYTAGY